MSFTFLRSLVITSALGLVSLAGSCADQSGAASACATGSGAVPVEIPVAPDADPATVAHVRIFNFVGPLMEAAAIDVCVQPQSAPAGSAWWGPVYRNTHTFPKYGKVAPYFDLPPDSYRLRIVPWGAAECEATLDGAREDLELDTQFAAGTYRTVVPSAWMLGGINGVAATPLTARVITDKSGYGSRELSVRFLNMDPSAPGIDVWKAPRNADPTTWQLLIDNVPFGQLGAATAASPFGATDANGYLSQKPRDWPESILGNVALCAHGSKTNCYIVNMQNVEGNITLFTSRTSSNSWKYNYISDGAKLFDNNQPRMTQSEDWW